MKKLLLILLLVSFPALAGDKEICVTHVKTHNSKAIIKSIKVMDIIDYYRTVDRKTKEIDKLITAACIQVLSKPCIDTTNTWLPVLRLYVERVNKIKVFALESDSIYYSIYTDRYNYVCGVNGKKSVAVVDNK